MALREAARMAKWRDPIRSETAGHGRRADIANAVTGGVAGTNVTATETRSEGGAGSAAGARWKTTVRRLQCRQPRGE